MHKDPAGPALWIQLMVGSCLVVKYGILVKLKKLNYKTAVSNVPAVAVLVTYSHKSFQLSLFKDSRTKVWNKKRMLGERKGG